MRVVGVAARRREVFDRGLEHGVDPRVLAYEAGWVVLRPIAADLDELQAVDGVGEGRARAVREGLSRLAESSLLERYV